MQPPSPPIDIEVKLAGELDVGRLVDLMREFYEESNFPLDQGWAQASFSALINNPLLGRAWLAFCGSTLVGHAVLTVRHCMEHGGLAGYIDDLFVRQAFRRQGVGRVLLSALFAECEARGCKAVQVEVGESNDAALALYAGFGLRAATVGRILLGGALASAGT